LLSMAKGKEECVYAFILYHPIVLIRLQHMGRVATNLENLEYSGISLNVKSSGNSVQPQGKIVTNKVFLVRHSNICVKLKQLFTGSS